ncbi:kinase-like domain-containing protein [Clohesyomyces aquaticus]|uniref:Kinase-like domain-containing protein n=1 Tax=Clohesyomyces aquaticus TaxID=1231657 RepID=A0A1Y1YRE7_9PLEO|nr:kinase-like domain-containing protein [Clohesyomyces aquaticus]
MHPTKFLFFAAYAWQSVAFPPHHEPHSLFPSLLLNTTDLSSLVFPLSKLFQPVARGVFPSQCVDDAATEEQGCFTLQDKSDSNVRLALAPEQGLGPGQSLGQGAFGSVVRGIFKDGQDVAVKLYESELSTVACQSSFAATQVLEGNENIIKSFARGKIQGKPALAMELAPDDTVESRMDNGEVGNQILDGLAYMHSKKVVHRDIKAANLAFKGDTVKVVDFDLVCRDECVDWVVGGDLGHASPEALEPKVDDINSYANDVWVTTITLVWMTTQEPPPNCNEPEFRAIWENDDADKRVEQIRKLWPNFSPEFAELLGDIFCRQKHRISSLVSRKAACHV